VYPLPPDDQTMPSRCAHCDGTILNWPDRAASVSLSDLLVVLRDRIMDE
jgi:hypothetical protein